MQERKRSGTATQSSRRKDEIEATKRIKILEPSPLTLLPCLSFILPKKNKPGDFKGKAFLFPEDWGNFKVMQNSLAFCSHHSWDGIGLSLCSGAAAVCTPRLTHTEGPYS